MKNNLHMQKDSKYFKLSLLTSMILGNSNINKDGKLFVFHDKKHLDYLYYKKELLDKAFHTKIPIIKNDNYGYCIQNKITNRLYNRLFKNGKEVMNMGVLNMIKTPYALLIWYLDKGKLLLHRSKENNKIISREVIFNINNYSLEENEIVKRWFKNNYDIVLTIKDNRNKKILKAGADQFNKFLNLLPKDLPKNMQYKLDMQYESF